jgi:hypothetical protein
VRTGHAFGDRIEILSGIAPGERVAVNPLAAMKQLKLAVQVAGSSEE